MLELWTARTPLERLLEQEGYQQRWFEWKAQSQPELEIGGFDMSYLDADAVEVRWSEWIKIAVEVDTGAGKTVWPQSLTYGKRIPGDVDLTFRTATGELVKSGKRLYVEGWDDWGVNLRVRGVQAPVCKPLLSVGEYTTMGGVTVLYGDKRYLFHRGSNVAKKIDAWIQKEMRDSQHHGCTVAYKENNRWETRPMRLASGRLRTCKTGKSRSRRSKRSRRSTRSNAR